MDSTTTTTDTTKTPKTRKTRKVLTKKEKEDCRAATEQLEAIFKGGPRPFELRPGALNLVVSKCECISKSCFPFRTPISLDCYCVIHCVSSLSISLFYLLFLSTTLVSPWSSISVRF